MYISEAYISELREVAKVSEELGHEDDFSDLDIIVRIVDSSSELKVLRDLVFIHYSIINPLLRVQDRILRRRILEYSASIENAPKCSGNYVYHCLEKYFDFDSVIEFLSGLDIQLVTPFRGKDEIAFVTGLQDCEDAIRSQFCAMCYLCGKLNKPCEEPTLKNLGIDDMQGEVVPRVKNGLVNYLTGMFHNRLLAEVMGKDSVTSFLGVLSELNRIRSDGGDIRFLESMTTSTERLLEVIRSDYEGHKGTLSPEELTIIAEVFSRRMPLAVEDDGKMVGLDEFLSTLRKKLDVALLDKYDSMLPLESFKSVVSKPDNIISYVGVKGMGHSDDRSFLVFKKIFRFLVCEGCIEDTYDNYKLLMLRLTGKNCGCEADSIAWRPVSLPKLKDADCNGARRLFYFFQQLVVTGKGRGSRKLVQTDEYFNIGGKKPSECLTSGDASGAANRVDQEFHAKVDKFLEKI